LSIQVAFLCCTGAVLSPGCVFYVALVLFCLSMLPFYVAKQPV
jgi:hypothetical protein